MPHHDIVIVGSSFAGLAVAHKLLKTVIPSLDSSTTYKVTMISASTHFWWTVGAPRAMFIPYPHDNSDSFIPIEKGFTQYPAGSFSFVHGSVTFVDPKTRSLEVKLISDANAETQVVKLVKYNSLVIATGAVGESPLYSFHGTHVPTLQAYEAMQKRVPAANSVLVVGGGAAGTETAGELGSAYGKKKAITILSGANHLLPRLRPAIGQQAQRYLEDMGVKVINNVKVQSSKAGPNGGPSTVELDNGETMKVDIVIMANGRTPATSFLPQSFLNSRKAVVVDDHLRVPVAGPNVYAIGDVASTSTGGAIDVMNMTPVLIANIAHDLGGGKLKEKEYKAMTKEMQIVPVGKSKGVGAVFGWWVPSIFVWLIKGRNFMFPNAMKSVMGTA